MIGDTADHEDYPVDPYPIPYPTPDSSSGGVTTFDPGRTTTTLDEVEGMPITGFEAVSLTVAGIIALAAGVALRGDRIAAWWRSKRIAWRRGRYR